MHHSRLFPWPAPRPLPSLVIAGAMKAGTTSLFEYLAGHPHLVRSRHKEVHFFDRHFHRGLGWYRRRFGRVPAGSGRAVAFESSPYYMFEPRVPLRMREALPEVRVVFLLRDPVERALSHYHNNRRLGREPLSFESAIDAEADRTAGEEERLRADPSYRSRAHQWFSYVARGRYAEQIVRWREHFPAERLLVLDAGRFFRDPAAVVGDVLAFLQLSPWLPPAFPPYNEGRYADTLQAATRQRLEALFEPSEQALEALIGWRPSARRLAA